LDTELLKRFITNALAEDVGDGDHTSLATIPHGTQGKAKLLVKDEGVIAGVELALLIFKAPLTLLLKVEVLIHRRSAC
jgi:nicotinate-nucleotide pyrophosphorylase (carboxylating)